MSDSARDAILGRLRAAALPRPGTAAPAAVPAPPAEKGWTPAERLARLRRMMEAVRTEFLEADQESWPTAVLGFLAAQGARNVLYGPGTDAGLRLSLAAKSGALPVPVAYTRPVEEWKAELFGRIDAGFTTTRGAIAETGSLVLWPSPAEPRLMSLVPPIHVALLETGKIRDTFRQVLREEGWAASLPANALLVSGPSKTADIEQTLAYGVHGPKRLVVVLLP